MAVGSVNVPGASALGAAKLAAVTIPKGRMRGDADGDGKITRADVRKIMEYMVQGGNVTDIDSWCSKIVEDENINATQASILLDYVAGKKTLDLLDYYGNWTQVHVSGQPDYWTTDIAVPGLTAGMSAVVAVPGEWDAGMFSGAEIFDRFIRISSVYPPIEDVLCHIIYGKGDGSATVCARTCSAPVPRIVEAKLYKGDWDAESKEYELNMDDIWTGLLADENAQLIQVFPKTNSTDAYHQCGIYQAGQKENLLYFAAQTIPTKDLDVRIVITDL